MSPNHLDVLIHYNGFAQPHPRFAAPAVQEAISFWVAQGFLEPDGGSASLFRTTERQGAHTGAVYLGRAEEVLADRRGSGTAQSTAGQLKMMIPPQQTLGRIARDPPTEADLIQADLQYNALKNSGSLQLQRDQSNFNAQVQQNLRNSPQRSLHDL
jgi:hypothetical protein